MFSFSIQTTKIFKNTSWTWTLLKQCSWVTYLPSYMNCFRSFTLSGNAVSLSLSLSLLCNLFIISCCYREAAEVLCLIFIDRILTAKVIERFTKKVKPLSHFSVSYISGCRTSVESLAPTQQKQILDSFRTGKVSYLSILL